MSQLYGTLTSDARRTQPTARGHRFIRAAAQTWTGSAALTITAEDGPDGPRVAIFAGPGSDPDPRRLLWTGPLADLLQPGARLRVEVLRRWTCSDCNGRGWYDVDDYPDRCPDCNAYRTEPDDGAAEVLRFGRGTVDRTHEG